MSQTASRSRGALALAGLLALAVPAAADTLKVPQDHETIQAAIDAAAGGDTISISSGTYTENLTIPPAKDGLVLAGKGQVFVDGQTAGNGISVFSSQVTIQNITFRHAAAIGIQASVPVEGIPVLTELTLDKVSVVNAAGAGVDIAVDGAVLENCSVVGCNGGVQVTGAGANLSKVSVTNDTGTGIAVVGNGAQVVGCTVDLVLALGIDVVGNTATIDKNKVSNVGDALVRLTGNNGAVTKNQGANAGGGIVVVGDTVVVDKNSVGATGGNQVDVLGATPTVTSNKLQGGGSHGVSVVGDNATISKNQIEHMGGAGVSYVGNTGTIEKNKAEHTVGSGFLLVTNEALVKSNQATACSAEDGAGLQVLGDDNVIESNTAKNCRTNGLWIKGSTNSLTKNKGLDNAINGILIESDQILKEGVPVVSLSNDLLSNVCTGNAGQGLLNEGVGTLIEKNNFKKNRLDLTNATAENASLVDQGGNKFDTGGLEVEPEILD